MVITKFRTIFPLLDIFPEVKNIAYLTTGVGDRQRFSDKLPGDTIWLTDFSVRIYTRFYFHPRYGQKLLCNKHRSAHHLHHLTDSRLLREPAGPEFPVPALLRLKNIRCLRDRR